jgi:hypothetical protein
MSRSFPIGQVAGLRISAAGSVFPAFVILWFLLGILGYLLLHFSPPVALLGGFLGAILHYLSELWHQVCHSWAARRTGYPMTGVRFWYFLGTSLYPRDEASLPAEIHIRRALGGPVGSLLLSLVMGLLTLLLRPAGGLLYGLAFFTFLENLVVFTLGSLLPLGFTDGSTLIYWTRHA